MGTTNYQQLAAINIEWTDRMDNVVSGKQRHTRHLIINN